MTANSPKAHLDDSFPAESVRKSSTSISHVLTVTLRRTLGSNLNFKHVKVQGVSCANAALADRYARFALDGTRVFNAELIS